MKESADDTDELIAYALSAMNQAREIPWVKELLEARERAEREEASLLAQAFEDGQRCSLGDEEAAALEYAERVMAAWIAKYPPHQPRTSPYDPVSQADQYRWWRLDEERAQLESNSYIADFRRALVGNFLSGRRGEEPAGF